MPHTERPIQPTDLIDALALTAALLEAGNCRGGLASTKQGRIVDVVDTTAVRFCLVGALERATFELDLSVLLRNDLIYALARNIGQDSFAGIHFLMGWFDDQTSLQPTRDALSAMAHSLSSK